jgi:RHS repeat-associated protein
VTTSYGYDARNQLVSLSGPVSASYTDNGAGERVSKTVNGTTTTFTWDPTGLGTVIADGTVENVFGPAGLAEQVDDASQTSQFAHADALGTIRLITDGDGNVVGTGSYSPWGTPESGSVTLGGFGFTGEQVDSETGFVYLRNRFYDPATGRFLTPDPLGALGSGVNLYAYVGNNPTSFTDPTGQCPWCVGAAIGAVAGAVVGATVYTATHQDDFSWKGAAEATAGGAVAGAIIGSGVGLVYGAVAAGAGGTAAAVGGTAATVGSGVAADDLESAVEAVDAAATGSEICPFEASTASESNLPEPEAGMKVYRVWGQDYDNNFGDDGSPPWRHSWTPVNPADVPNPRSGLGLPNENMGRFVSEGVLTDTTGVRVRAALPLDGNEGGLAEFLFPNPEQQIVLTRVSGVNPPY